jgi:hypothetical protein
MHWFARWDISDAGRRVRWLVTAVRHSSLLATQSLVQLTLFFALPFYFRAASFGGTAPAARGGASFYVGHIVFVSVLCVVSAISLWDPLTEWLLMRPLFSPLLPAIGSFVALTAVLPALGLSTRVSLWIAAAAATTGVVLLSALAAPAGQRKRVVALALLPALLLPLALQLGVARIVPAAPLRLVKIEFGTRLSERWVADPSQRFQHAPARLFCATAIASPIGVRDRLFHVWRHDGEERARIELDVRGGRGAGFRTFSRLQPGAGAVGTYRCSVETAAGQVLGDRSIRIGE